MSCAPRCRVVAPLSPVDPFDCSADPRNTCERRSAPQREVQCGQEREDIIACLARENDTLKCADVAAAFEACAGKVITVSAALQPYVCPRV